MNVLTAAVAVVFFAFFASSAASSAASPPSVALFPNASSSPPPGAGHVVNMNVSVSYALVRTGTELPRLAVNVTVPRVRDGTGGACPFVYLVDTIDPTTPVHPETEVSYVATLDRLGKARTPCAVLNFTHDPSTFDHESEISKVTSRWRVRLSEHVATYETIEPFAFDDLVATCGATHENIATPLLGASYPTQKYRWSIHACQAGYYGPRCESSFGEYAATCVRSDASARLGPVVSSLASGVETIARPMSGEIAFEEFDTTDAGGCRSGMTRGVVTFALALKDFDELADVRYLNPPPESGGGMREIAVPQTNASISFVPSREGVFVYGSRPLPDDRVAWNVTIVTDFVSYASKDAFSRHFANLPVPVGYVTRFSFSATTRNGASLSLVVTVDGSVLIDETPKNGTCVAPPPSPPSPPSPPENPPRPPAVTSASPPPPGPDVTTGGGRGGWYWPWLIPASMTLVLETAAALSFATGVVLP